MKKAFGIGLIFAWLGMHALIWVKLEQKLQDIFFIVCSIIIMGSGIYVYLTCKKINNDRISIIFAWMCGLIAGWAISSAIPAH